MYNCTLQNTRTLIESQVKHVQAITYTQIGQLLPTPTLNNLPDTCVSFIIANREDIHLAKGTIGPKTCKALGFVLQLLQEVMM